MIVASMGRIKGVSTKVCLIKIKGKIQHTVHNMEYKAHFGTLFLDGFIQ